MPQSPFAQNNNELPTTAYTPSGYEKAKLRKLLLLVGVVLVVCALAIVLIARSSQPDKNTQSATAAARKSTPHAIVSNVKAAGGFAFATVKDPDASGQANAGNVTVFKINKDGSMTQLAKGSSFSVLDLLNLGIPLTTQAKLTASSIDEVKKSLENICGYSGGTTPGFNGFGGSFDPDDWQIDSTTLSGLQLALSGVVNTSNGALVDTNSDEGNAVKSGNTVVCVNAIRKGSNATTDMKTYISTFTLQMQFITFDGKITSHTVTFAIGPKHYRHYTLDGQAI